MNPCNHPGCPGAHQGICPATGEPRCPILIGEPGAWSWTPLQWREITSAARTRRHCTGDEAGLKMCTEAYLSMRAAQAVLPTAPAR